MNGLKEEMQLRHLAATLGPDGALRVSADVQDVFLGEDGKVVAVKPDAQQVNFVLAPSDPLFVGLIAKLDEAHQRSLAAEKQAADERAAQAKVVADATAAEAARVGERRKNLTFSAGHDQALKE